MRGTDRRSTVAFGLLGAAGLLPRPSARAQEAAYPTRPVRLLVGFPPGGPLDFMARALAERLAQRLGQPFPVENRPGASGGLAAEAVARAAPPDGHLLLMGNHSNLAVNPVLQRDLPYDPARDLAPVAQVTAVPLVVAAAADLPARSMVELVALARARPGQLNAGTAGTGTLQYLTLELLKQRAGKLDILHVPFRGAVEVGRELMAGRLHLGIDAYITFRAGMEAGKVRVLASTHAERLPDLPTVAETPGLEGFEATGFVGVAGPAGMPRPALARLEAAVAWAMRETDLPRVYEAQDLLPRFAGAEGFAALIARDREKWSRVAREAGIIVG